MPKFIGARAIILAAATLSMLPLAACNQAGLDGATPTPAQARPTPTPGDKMQPPPADFSVQYEWRAGSMPPPYHYEYTIRVGPGAQGQIVYRPDYESKGVPTWTETITVTSQQLAGLYALVVDRKLLRENWGRVQDPPVGGSVQWAEITAGGKTYKIPTQLQGFQESAAAHLYEAVKALVPQATWDKLEAQREQYVKDYQARDGD
ncbi:MAG TPA: hypothetical protein VF914_19085 [Chloroflexia bacterium]